MKIYRLTLHKSYFNHGFFNVPVAFDACVRRDEGPVSLVLISSAGEQRGTARVDRNANPNGTARIFGGTTLRDWFQRRFRQGDHVEVDLSSSETLLIRG